MGGGTGEGRCPLLRTGPELSFIVEVGESFQGGKLKFRLHHVKTFRSFLIWGGRAGALSSVDSQKRYGSGDLQRCGSLRKKGDR